MWLAHRHREKYGKWHIIAMPTKKLHA